MRPWRDWDGSWKSKGVEALLYSLIINSFSEVDVNDNVKFVFILKW